MHPKRLPYDKTVVAEVRVQLADLLSRSTRLKGSIALPLAATQSFNNGDFNSSLETPWSALNIQTVLILSCMTPFRMFLKQQGNTVELLCNGFFLHSGAAEEVVVLPPPGLDSIRFQYVWS